MEIKKKRFIRPEVTVMDVQAQSLLAGSADLEQLNRVSLFGGSAKANAVDWESGDLN